LRSKSGGFFFFPPKAKGAFFFSFCLLRSAIFGAFFSGFRPIGFKISASNFRLCFFSQFLKFVFVRLALLNLFLFYGCSSACGFGFRFLISKVCFCSFRGFFLVGLVLARSASVVFGLFALIILVLGLVLRFDLLTIAPHCRAWFYSFWALVL
jgi:hypothetical protein